MDFAVQKILYHFVNSILHNRMITDKLFLSFCRKDLIHYMVPPIGQVTAMLTQKSWSYSENFNPLSCITPKWPYFIAFLLTPDNFICEWESADH